MFPQRTVAGRIPNMKMVSEGRGVSQLQQQDWELLRWVLESNTFTVRSMDVEKKVGCPGNNNVMS